MISKLKCVSFLLAFSLLLSGLAEAQWIYLGRKALGKVQQLTGETQGSPQSGYDAATVLLEAPADKVYGTAVEILKGKKDWRLTKKDDPSRTLQFTDGRLTAGLQVSRLEDHLSQLLIVSAGSSGKSEATSLVLNGVMHICREMGVHCQLAE